VQAMTESNVDDYLIQTTINAAFRATAINMGMAVGGAAICSHALYALHGCDITNSPGVNQLPDEVTTGMFPIVSNIELSGTRLSFDVETPTQPGLTSYIFSDENLSSSEVSVINPNVNEVSADTDVQRLSDGTEKMDWFNNFGSTMAYQENPDCSGNLSWTEHKQDFTDPAFELSVNLNWSSPRTGDMIVDYVICSATESGENKCQSGQY